MIADRGRRTAHDHADHVLVVANRRRHQIEAGNLRVAGLDAVGTLKRGEKIVVGAVDAAAVSERRDREVVIILREIIGDMTAKQGHVARRGELLEIGQA